MSGDYLWDRSGPPDPEVVRLEDLLGRFRLQGPLDARLPSGRRRGLLRRLRPALLAAGLLLAAAAGWRFLSPPAPAGPFWEVARIEGTPSVGSAPVRGTGRLGVGEWLVTDARSRARLTIADIGRAEIDPETRVRLLASGEGEHGMELARGRIEALVWAPPRQFYVETPSARAVDLGCRFTLEVDEGGGSLLHVQTGWVAFTRGGQEMVVPRGAVCRTRSGIGPGTPHFEDAPAGLSRALDRLDFEAGGREALEAVLGGARARDTLTLWNLLARVEGEERELVHDRMAALVPPPRGVTREGMLALDPEMRERWKDHLEETSW